MKRIVVMLMLFLFGVSFTTVSFAQAKETKAAQKNRELRESGATPGPSQGVIFRSNAGMENYIPGDVQFVNPSVDQVGVHCNDSGAQDGRATPMCSNFVSPSTGERYVHQRYLGGTKVFKVASNGSLFLYVQATRHKYDKKAGTSNGEITYDYVSPQAQQYAQAHGSTQVVTRSQPQPTATDQTARVPVEATNAATEITNAVKGIGGLFRK